MTPTQKRTTSRPSAPGAASNRASASSIRRAYRAGRPPSPRRASDGTAGRATPASSSTSGEPSARASARGAPRAPSRIAAASSGGATTPGPVSRISSAAAPSGGTTARIGRPDGDVLEHLPREHALAPAARLGDEQQQRLRVALERERRPRAARTGVSSSRSPRPSVSAHVAVGLAEVAEEARHDVEPESASACRNGRGSRRPKKLPVCVIRKRSDGGRSSPATSSKSAPFGIVTTGPRGASARVSAEIASETHVIASARDGDEAARRGRASPPSPSSRSCRRADARARRASRGGRRPSGCPVARAIAAAIRCVEPRRRRRDDDVDPVLAHEPDPGRDRGQRPGRVLVRDDEPPELEPRLRQGPLEPLRAGEDLRRLAAAHAHVPGAMHPRLGRHRGGSRRGGASAGRRARARASRSPSRQVLRELQRPLHAAAARGREVEADEQGLHRRAIVHGAPAPSYSRYRIQRASRYTGVERRLEAEPLPVDEQPLGAAGARDREVAREPEAEVRRGRARAGGCRPCPRRGSSGLRQTRTGRTRRGGSSAPATRRRPRRRARARARRRGGRPRRCSAAATRTGSSSRSRGRTSAGGAGTTRAQRSARAAGRMRSPRTSATRRPATPTSVAHAGPPSSSV